jgi:hypothetical protein
MCEIIILDINLIFLESILLFSYYWWRKFSLVSADPTPALIPFAFRSRWWGASLVIKFHLGQYFFALRGRVIEQSLLCLSVRAAVNANYSHFKVYFDLWYTSLLYKNQVYHLIISTIGYSYQNRSRLFLGINYSRVERAAVGTRFSIPAGQSHLGLLQKRLHVLPVYLFIMLVRPLRYLAWGPSEELRIFILLKRETVWVILKEREF